MLSTNKGNSSVVKSKMSGSVSLIVVSYVYISFNDITTGKKHKHVQSDAEGWGNVVVFNDLGMRKGGIRRMRRRGKKPWGWDWAINQYIDIMIFNLIVFDFEYCNMVILLFKGCITVKKVIFWA